MKVFKYFFITLFFFLLDIILNGLVGRFFFITTPFAFSYYVSFFTPKIVRLVSAFFVITEALLYGIATPYFCTFVGSLIIISPFLHKTLRDEKWVRWVISIFLLSIFYFLLSLL